jgi:hypothetical protein
VWGISRQAQCCDANFWHAFGSRMVGSMSAASTIRGKSRESAACKPCVEGPNQICQEHAFCLLKRHPIVVIMMVREPTVVGWVPVLDSPNLRRGLWSIAAKDLIAGLTFTRGPDSPCVSRGRARRPGKIIMSFAAGRGGPTPAPGPAGASSG